MILLKPSLIYSLLGFSFCIYSAELVQAKNGLRCIQLFNSINHVNSNSKTFSNTFLPHFEIDTTVFVPEISSFGGEEVDVSIVGQLEGDQSLLGKDSSDMAPSHLPDVFFLNKNPLDIRVDSLVKIPRLRKQPTNNSCMTEALINLLRYISLNNSNGFWLDPKMASNFLTLFRDPREGYNKEKWNFLQNYQLEESKSPLLLEFLRRVFSNEKVFRSQEYVIANYLASLGIRAHLEKNADRIKDHLRNGWPAIIGIGGRMHYLPAIYRTESGEKKSIYVLEPSPKYNDFDIISKYLNNGKGDRTIGNHSILALKVVSDKTYEGHYPTVLVMDSGDGQYKFVGLDYFNKESIIEAILITPQIDS